LEGDAERARRVLFVQSRGEEGDLLQKIVRIAMGGGGGQQADVLGDSLPIHALTSTIFNDYSTLHVSLAIVVTINSRSIMVA
jgi:hypothetical protein